VPQALTDPWTDRLSERLDGSLSPEEAGLLDAHLVTCADCRAVLADLERVVMQARALPAIAPDEDLWPGIAARVASFARAEEAPRAVRRRPVSFGPGITMSWPQLMAAGFALVVLSGGGALYFARGHRATQAALPPNSSTELAAASHIDPQYAAEVQDLQKVLDERRSQLDPETVKTIEANLKIIDLATNQARQALAADPANPYLKDYLSNQMKRKVELLKQATVYATAQ
jgi:anti-sigma factor RsiW